MALTSDLEDRIPQIISIVPLLKDGKVSLKKDVRDHLGRTAYPLYLDAQEEIHLTPRGTPSAIPAETTARHLLLPESTLAALELEKGDLLSLVEREGAVALKKLEVREEESIHARLVDCETPRKVERIVEAAPMPDRLIPLLSEQHRDLSLRHDVRRFLQNRQTLAAWKARRLLGLPAAEDDLLRERLIRDRLDARSADGSWDDDVVLTARNLRELGELGLTRADAEFDRSAQWLLVRPRSQWNPGMFFLTDELVDEQARFLDEKKRFCALKTGEMKRVCRGDDLIAMPCGPRIMWPNALALEALLGLGYEGDERVQTALTMMLAHDWCECDYQNGTKNWRRIEPLDAARLDAFEQDCIAEYRYGGLPDIGDLARMDLTRKTGLRLRRAARASEDGVDVYPLEMPVHFQGCEAITTRAMSRVVHPQMRRFAEAHSGASPAASTPRTALSPARNTATARTGSLPSSICSPASTTPLRRRPSCAPSPGSSPTRTRTAPGAKTRSRMRRHTRC